MTKRTATEAELHLEEPDAQKKPYIQPIHMILEYERPNTALNLSRVWNLVRFHVCEQLHEAYLDSYECKFEFIERHNIIEAYNLENHLDPEDPLYCPGVDKLRSMSDSQMRDAAIDTLLGGIGKDKPELRVEMKKGQFHKNDVESTPIKVWSITESCFVDSRWDDTPYYVYKPKILWNYDSVADAKFKIMYKRICDDDEGQDALAKCSFSLFNNEELESMREKKDWDLIKDKAMQSLMSISKEEVKDLYEETFENYEISVNECKIKDRRPLILTSSPKASEKVWSVTQVYYEDDYKCHFESWSKTIAPELFRTKCAAEKRCHQLMVKSIMCEEYTDYASVIEELGICSSEDLKSKCGSEIEEIMMKAPTSKVCVVFDKAVKGEYVNVTYEIIVNECTLND
jgi:hypothetical protein